jgi:hypothetical protein
MNMATPTDVDRDAPVLTDLAIDINAPPDRVWRLHTDVNVWPTWQPDITNATAEEPLRTGASFSWSTYGMDITSTVYVLDEGARILWGGTANGITGVHEWTFADSPGGVRVTTTESFPVSQSRRTSPTCRRSSTSRCSHGYSTSRTSLRRAERQPALGPALTRRSRAVCARFAPPAC